MPLKESVIEDIWIYRTSLTQISSVLKFPRNQRYVASKIRIRRRLAPSSDIILKQRCRHICKKQWWAARCAVEHEWIAKLTCMIFLSFRTGLGGVSLNGIFEYQLFFGKRLLLGMTFVNEFLKFPIKVKFRWQLPHCNQSSFLVRSLPEINLRNLSI